MKKLLCIMLAIVSNTSFNSIHTMNIAKPNTGFEEKFSSNWDKAHVDSKSGAMKCAAAAITSWITFNYVVKPLSRKIQTIQTDNALLNSYKSVIRRIDIHGPTMITGTLSTATIFFGGIALVSGFISPKNEAGAFVIPTAYFALGATTNHYFDLSIEHCQNCQNNEHCPRHNELLNWYKNNITNRIIITSCLLGVTMLGLLAIGITSFLRYKD